MIGIITARGVLNKKKIPAPVLKATKAGINGIRTRKAIATDQILSWGCICLLFL